MAETPGDTLHQDQVFETVFLDVKGGVVLRNEAGVFTTSDLDGNTVERHLAGYFETVDGVLVSPPMLRPPNPILLVRCHRCHRPPLFRRRSHGLATAEHSSRCVSCQRWCCQKHTRLCADDNFRCIKCARRYRIARFFLLVFFKPA